MLDMSRRAILAVWVTTSLGASLAAGAALAADSAPVERWGLFEIALDGPKEGNPFADVTVSAEFRQGEVSYLVPGFYDGGGVYRVRFSPDSEGAWTWRTRSNAAALDGRSGTVLVTQPSPGNHGPVRVTRDGYHFAYADGTPFRQIGTTCYSWAQQSDARCDETLRTLKASPFNKIRMLVFPNVAAEPLAPFAATGPGPEDWDAARFNPAYFRRFEDRVARLMALGIQADIILFHPYDKARGYSDMTPQADARYLRYIVARLSAFRNVWWSMANEFDLIKTKSTGDWDRVFQVVRDADPHGRLRSMHNCHVFYDNRKPWVTHSSIQNGSAVVDDSRAEIYRDVWEKAVVFDEVCYEGRIEARWGRLGGEEMVARFWHGTVAGAYVGHSEVLTREGGGADASWLGKGGTLIGTSPPRLAFLKAVLEAGPVPGIEPIDKWWDRHLGGQAGRYYLRYFGREAPSEWTFELPRAGLNGGESFRVEVLDTWEMTVTPVEGVFTLAASDRYSWRDPARPSVALPGKPWQALRVTRA